MKKLLASFKVATVAAGIAYASGVAMADDNVTVINDDWLSPARYTEYNVPEGRTVVFNGKIGFAGTSNCAFKITGPGTKIIRGGIDTMNCTETDNDSNVYAPQLSGGTFLIDGEVRMPRVIIGGGAHVILTNGATFALSRKAGTVQNTFLQDCVIDIHNSVFRNDSCALLVAQNVNSTAHVRVYDGGVFDTGVISYRPANNGIAIFSIFDGGTLQWTSGSLSENGRSTINLEGGRLMRWTDGGGDFLIGQTPANVTSYQNKGGNVINLNGGEFWTTRIENNSNVDRNKGTHTTVNFNGSTIKCANNAEDFWAGRVDLVDGNVLDGGVRVDTRGFNVGWNLGCVGAAQDGEDGGLVKLGAGTLTIKSAQSFSGSVKIVAGTLTASDASFLTQRIELSAGAAFAPGGAASIAGFSATDGILQVVAGSAVTVASAPVVNGRLYVRLVDANGAAVTECGTYDVLSAPGVDAAFAAKCRAIGGAADRVYAFDAADGKLRVTLSEGTNPDASLPLASAWTATSGGAWEDAANWSAGVPDGFDAEATFGGALAAAGVVSVADDKTVGKIVFDSNASYTIAGDCAINFVKSGGDPMIRAEKGSHEIALPIMSEVPVKISAEGNASVKLTGDLSGAAGVEVAAGRVVVDDAAQMERITLAGGTVNYVGAAGGASPSPRLVGNGTIVQTAGAGELTLTSAPEMTRAGTLYIQGNGTEEVVLSGAGWTKAPNDYHRLWLTGGKYRFADDLRLYWRYLNKASDMTGGMFCVGKNANAPTTLTIDGGAQVRVHDAFFGADAEKNGSPVTVTQNGGVFDMSGDLRFNSVAQTNALTFAKSGGRTIGGAWLNFMYGPTTFRQSGGETEFRDLAFGYHLDTGVNYTKWEYPGNGLIDVAGGKFSVEGNWSWASDASNGRTDRVRVSGGELAMPATKRAKAYDRKNPGNYSTLELAGGTLRLRGAGTGGSTGNYLAGLNTFALSGAASVDTDGNDAVITQPMWVTGEAASLTKTGEGALTLAATNDVPGAVRVEAGTLAAGFRTEAFAKRPDGLLALWTFDGENPYRDVTGNGYDLEQAVGGKDVQFTEDLAHAGKCAWWQTGGAALKCTNATTMKLLRTTVSLWVRLETKDQYLSHIGMFSMRVNSAMNGTGSAFDLAYKQGIGNVLAGPGIGNCFFGSNYTGIPAADGGDISVREWHMITITRDGGRVRSYVDGVFAREAMLTGNPVGGTMLENGRIITLGANIANESSLREMMNVNGRLDDVAIYSRCLSDEEVAALYAAEQKAPVADEVRVAEGATLDLRGTAIAARTLGGAGTVTGGAVTALERLEVDPELPIGVGELVLGENGVLDCGRTAEDPLPASGTWVVVNAGGVTGAPPRGWSVTGTGVDANRARYRLDVDESGNLVMVGAVGTTIIIR